MEKRILGADLELSAIGLGCMSDAGNDIRTTIPRSTPDALRHNDQPLVPRRRVEAVRLRQSPKTSITIMNRPRHDRRIGSGRDQGAAPNLTSRAP